MFTTLATSKANRFTHPSHQYRTDELAKMLVNALGYEGAIERAEKSHWDTVAQTIHFLQSQTYRRY